MISITELKVDNLASLEEKVNAKQKTVYNSIVINLRESGVDNETLKRIAKEMLNVLVSESLLYFRLNLSWNSVKDEAFEAILNILTKAKLLKELYLNFAGGGNSIGDTGMLTLVDKCLLKMPKLSTVHLSFSRGDNKITDIGLESLIKALAKLNIIHLTLDFSAGKHKLTHLGFQSIANNLLAKLKSLQTLDLDFGWTQIKDEPMEAFARALIELSKLSKFSLRFPATGVTDEGFSMLVQALMNMASITHLCLNFNESNKSLSGESLRALGSALKNLVKLQVFELDWAYLGNFQEADVSEILNSFYETSTLKSLVLNFCEKEGVKNEKLQELIDMMIPQLSIPNIQIKC